VKYLFYWFKSISQKIIDAGRGATVHGVTLPFIKSLEIPLPSLATQQKIVAKLDVIFAEIDKAVLATEANVKNAESLFHSYLSQVFEHGVESWGTTTLDKVCRVDRGSSPRPIKNYFTENEDGVNWIKIGDTEEGGKYIFSTNQKITKEGAEKSRYVSVGDFILTNSMSYGRPYIMRINGYIHDGWFVLRLNENLDSEFFYYLLTSPFVQNQFKSLAAGAVVKNISGDLVKKTVLPIPDLTTQKTIAEIFTEKQKLLTSLSESYEKKISELKIFRNSILKQAFNGELVKD
jgi:type I restriction enzyme S subunit